MAAPGSRDKPAAAAPLHTPASVLAAQPDVVVGVLVDLGDVSPTYAVMETLSPVERAQQLAALVDNVRLAVLRVIGALTDAGLRPLCRCVTPAGRPWRACLLVDGVAVGAGARGVGRQLAWRCLGWCKCRACALWAPPPPPVNHSHARVSPPPLTHTLYRFDFFDSMSRPRMSPVELQQHLDQATAARIASLRTPTRVTAATFGAFTRELSFLARCAPFPLPTFTRCCLSHSTVTCPAVADSLATATAACRQGDRDASAACSYRGLGRACGRYQHQRQPHG